MVKAKENPCRICGSPSGTSVCRRCAAGIVELLGKSREARRRILGKDDELDGGYLNTDCRVILPPGRGKGGCRCGICGGDSAVPLCDGCSATAAFGKNAGWLRKALGTARL